MTRPVLAYSAQQNRPVRLQILSADQIQIRQIQFNPSSSVEIQIKIIHLASKLVILVQTPQYKSILFYLILYFSVTTNQCHSTHRNTIWKIILHNISIQRNASKIFHQLHNKSSFVRAFQNILLDRQLNKMSTNMQTAAQSCSTFRWALRLAEL